MTDRARQLIASLGLQPHPEGGHYLETWRSAGAIPEAALPPGFAGGSRAFSTAILFLLQSHECSVLHRIASDELWFFLEGDPLEVLSLSTDAEPVTVVRLGSPPHGVLTHVVPAGHTFGARVAAGGAFALMACVVAPGFDFRDFSMPSRSELLDAFPSHTALVMALSRDDAPASQAS